MALIVETGAIVTGADSYVTRADAITYAANRGVTLVDTVVTDEILRNAVGFLESFGDKFKGSRVTRDQPLSWPRIGAVIEGWSWDSDEIPRQVINAQLAVALEIFAGEDPYNPLPVAGQITQESVSGAVSVSYATGSSGAQKVTKTRNAITMINLLTVRSGLFAVRA